MLHAQIKTLQGPTFTERGAVATAAAVLIGLVLMIGVWLSVDTTRVYEGRVVATMLADQVCAVAVTDLPITRNALETALKTLKTFTDVHRSPLLPYITVKEATFIIPTMITELGIDSPNKEKQSPEKLGLPECTGYKCSIDVNVDDATAANYPDSFWSNNNKYNGYLGCEIEVEIRTLLSQTRTTKSKVAYRQRLRGEHPSNNTSRGVVVAVAPYVETLNDVRFTFSNDLAASFNPLQGESTSISNLAFTEDRADCPGCLKGPAIGNDFSGNSKPSEDDRKNWLRRCLNPYTAVRNTVLQSLMARLARHHETRTETEVLLISPYGTWPNGNPNKPTDPVVVARRGQDLTARAFTMPFINRRLKGAAACPMTSCNEKEQDMLFVSQLRDCLMVHNQHNGTDTPADPNVTNKDFEPVGPWLSPKSVVPPYPNHEDAYTGWGHTGQMNGNTPIRFTVEQLVRMLPNVQESPTIFPTPIPGEKPEATPAGLRPALTAFLNYTRTESNAYSSPGFLRVNIPQYAEWPGPPNLTSESANAHIVIFISKRLGPDGDKENIKNSIEKLNQDTTRRITVVYIPTTKADASKKAFDELKEAFDSPKNLVIRVGPAFDDANKENVCTNKEEATCLRDFWEGLLKTRVSEIGRNIWNTMVLNEVAL
jgi:hypothetical protein